MKTLRYGQLKSSWEFLSPLLGMTEVRWPRRGQALLFGAAGGPLPWSGRSPPHRGDAGPKPVTPPGGHEREGGRGAASTFGPPEKPPKQKTLFFFFRGVRATRRAKGGRAATGLARWRRPRRRARAARRRPHLGGELGAGRGGGLRREARRAPVQEPRPPGANPTDGRRCAGPAPGSATDRAVGAARSCAFKSRCAGTDCTRRSPPYCRFRFYYYYRRYY